MEVEARVVRLQLAETFVIAREATDVADVVLVEVRHEGRSGFGEGAPIARYGESAASAKAFVDEYSGLLGNDPFALEDIDERLAAVEGEQAAKAAVDAALHDLQGKLLELPTFRLLGLPRSGPPTSWTVWLGEPDDMARRATRGKRMKPRIGRSLGAER